VTEAYVDESHYAGPPGFYVLAAALFDTAAAVEAQAAMRDLARTLGVMRVHWHDLDADRREFVAAAVEKLDFETTVIVASPPSRNQERARRQCLAALLWTAAHRRVNALTFESRGGRRDREDLKAVDTLRKGRRVPVGQRIEFALPVDEPLLWVADTIAGATSSAERGDPSYLRAVARSDDVLRIALT
jgi:hypothetical protein